MYVDNKEAKRVRVDFRHFPAWIKTSTMSIFFFKEYCGMISKFAVIFMVQKYQVRSQNDWIIGWTRLMSESSRSPIEIQLNVGLIKSKYLDLYLPQLAEINSLE